MSLKILLGPKNIFLSFIEKIAEIFSFKAFVHKMKSNWTSAVCTGRTHFHILGSTGLIYVFLFIKKISLFKNFLPRILLLLRCRNELLNALYNSTYVKNPIRVTKPS